MFIYLFINLSIYLRNYLSSTDLFISTFVSLPRYNELSIYLYIDLSTIDLTIYVHICVCLCAPIDGSLDLFQYVCMYIYIYDHAIRRNYYAYSGHHAQ